jgi:hypothetical protein
VNVIRQYGHFINSWQWEWFSHFTCREPVSKYTAERQLLSWIRSLCTTERIQIACVALVNCTNLTPHWHALMFGKNKNGRTLLDVSEKRWVRKWPGIARIEPRRNNNAVSHYVANNITLWNSDLYEVFIYNNKLLKAYKRARQD